MRQLPRFNARGLLPPGEYPMSLTDLRSSYLVAGIPDDALFSCWDQGWRGVLVNRLEILVRQLWEIEVQDIYIDGSFVEQKDHPNDIDGYFSCDLIRLGSGELERELNLLDPYKTWTWDPSSRRPYHGYAKRQLPMWHQYRIELYPHVGQISGIRDGLGQSLDFATAFRRSRQDGLAKGIVKIVR